MVFGATSLIVMLTCVEVEPPELLAETVYVTAVVCKFVGVPLMTPVLALNAIPDGMDGLMVQLVAVPPLTLGLLVVIVTPLVNVMFSVA